MTSFVPRAGPVVWIAGIVAACIAAIALHSAVQWYDHPVGGLFLLSDMEVSDVGSPSWDGLAQGLAYPDRILSINGADLRHARSVSGAQLWDRELVSSAKRGAATVHVQAQTSAGVREMDLRIDRVTPALWWLYGGGLILTGCLYVIGALTALASSPGGNLSRAFAKFALLAAVYFFGFFDSETTLALLPVFYVAFAWGPLALVGLALRLPDDAPIARRFPAIFRILDLLGLSAGLVMAERSVVGDSTVTLRAAWSVVIGCSMLAFVAIFVGRFLVARGPRRETLRILLQAIALPYSLIGVGVLAAMLSPRGASSTFLLLPALALAPIGTAVASAKHNLWGSRMLLSRVATLTVSGGLTCALAASLGGAFAASLGVPFREALAAAGAGATASGPLVYLVLRAVERTFFPAVAGYKPTIEQLSEELLSVSAPREVAIVVERSVRRWLPCDHVEFVVREDRDHGAVDSPRNSRHVQDLLIPAQFGGRTLATLHVGGKRGGALFTTEDVTLLRTIANHAALAVAYVRSYAELEQRRQQQAAAWQVERLALVETLAAEVAHEVRYPINFFRSVFQRNPGDGKLEDDEIEVGCEEVDRLERLVSGLRRLVGHRVERHPVALADLAGRMEIILRDALASRTLRMDLPNEVSLRCDPDQIRQVLVNLVSNALDASGPRGRVGIDWEPTTSGADLVVWDDGPGFDGDPANLFAAWFTTKAHGTGLGLAITQRIVRAHNWKIDAMRHQKLTRFVIAIPRLDIVEPSVHAMEATS
jgi:signal transduction histidine kinase